MYLITGKCICFEIAAKFVPKCPIDSMWVLGLVIGSGDMQVPKRMVTIPSCHLLYLVKFAHVEEYISNEKFCPM